MNEEDSLEGSRFWWIIRTKFDKTNGLVITLMITFISIAFGFIDNYSAFIRIAISISVFLSLVLIVLIWTFYRAADDLYHENISLKINKNNLPALINIRKNEDSTLCLLRPSNLFSINAIVTLYEYHDHYEHPIGFGEVVNIQDDGIIQIELTQILRGQEKIFEKLIQNNAECLRRIRVKPLILKKYLKYIRGGI